jgi:hypothetical protein
MEDEEQGESESGHTKTRKDKSGHIEDEGQVEDQGEVEDQGQVEDEGGGKNKQKDKRAHLTDR